MSRQRVPGAGPDDADWDTAVDADEDSIDDSASGESDSGLSGNFYSGLIIFLDRARGRGTVRSYSGREIRFEFPFVSVVGAPLGGRAPGINLLKEGDSVGFDVGWTSKGLRVTTIRPAIPPTKNE
jgi:hypothetical protein